MISYHLYVKFLFDWLAHAEYPEAWQQAYNLFSRCRLVSVRISAHPMAVHHLLVHDRMLHFYNNPNQYKIKMQLCFWRLFRIQFHFNIAVFCFYSNMRVIIFWRSTGCCYTNTGDEKFPAHLFVFYKAIITIILFYIEINLI